ncbi:PstS family phosphate ABC transporter substrate-binding protein [Lentibacillus cibarius]|uniref:Phosphate-binding protein n=1 Tax=Lentibacillus cibarius TaxID=2583219 RepID=A0A5S3QLC4_9BACI|nr:PstS family phosphate ABC transporter substrate-binding protein [Lentibacillus cibarius]TMN22665.1 phosphate ABC transporter substrate-binding protein PstS family protein [Lentibacillus cibarius]
MKSKSLLVLAMISLLLVVLTACGNTEDSEESGNEEASSKTEQNTSEKGNSASENETTEVMVDGSSTVFPIMEAVAEEYQKENPDARVNIGTSGSGGGFEKFAAGETHISNASRPIKNEEKAALEEAGIDYTEFEIALDGLSIVVNKENDWVDQLTVEELNKMWSADGDVTTWADVREGWPEEEIQFYSPGADSGTFDYFSEVVFGEESDIRQDASLSEDDNVLVQGVTGSKNGISYFGYAYYAENKDQLKAVPIVNDSGEAVTPNQETVQSGEYNPFARPLFIYVKHSALENVSVYNFTKYALENAGAMAESVGYVAKPESAYEEALNKLDEIAGK